jgi:hypothetical protein
MPLCTSQFLATRFENEELGGCVFGNNSKAMLLCHSDLAKNDSTPKLDHTMETLEIETRPIF